MNNKQNKSTAVTESSKLQSNGCCVPAHKHVSSVLQFNSHSVTFWVESTNDELRWLFQSFLCDNLQPEHREVEFLTTPTMSTTNWWSRNIETYSAVTNPSWSRARAWIVCWIISTQCLSTSWQPATIMTLRVLPSVKTAESASDDSCKY